MAPEPGDIVPTSLVPPLEVQGDYDLEVCLVRNGLASQPAITFPVGSTSCDLLLDHGMRIAGLQMIDGISVSKTSDKKVVTASPLQDDDAVHLVSIMVRHQTPSVKIDVRFDGRPLVAWSGDADRLSSFKNWRPPQPNQIGLGVYYKGTSVTYTSARVRLLRNGRPTPDAVIPANTAPRAGVPAKPSDTRKATVPAPVASSGKHKEGSASQGRSSEGNNGAPPLAISPFNASEARKHQEAWAKHLGEPVEVVNSIGMKFRLIPPGEFDMGATPEELVWAVQKGRENNEQPWYFDLASSATPRHRVTIRQPFYLAVFETTRTEYQTVTGRSPSSATDTSKLSPPRSERTAKSHAADTTRVPGTDTNRHPVETISWEEAAEFCRHLSALPEERLARRVYLLVTEGQWEYACRAGSCGKWNVGDQEENLVDAAWFRKTSDWTTHSVGQKRPNAWGLHDMHGNVSEWCQDWFDLKYYSRSPAADPQGASTGSHRVARGGSWVNSSFHCRSATRYSFPPAIRQHETGFRVLCEVPEARGASQEANNKQ